MMEQQTTMVVDTPYHLENQVINVLNPEDKDIWRYCYYIGIGHYRSIEKVVYADCLQDAIDYVIDWAEKQPDTDGWWLPDEGIKAESDILDEYIYGGNYCRYMSFGTDELIIKEQIQ